MGKKEFNKEFNATLYVFDCITIDLCLTLFPWVTFKKVKGAVKAHTLIDLQENITAWLYITMGRVHDARALYHLHIKSGSYYEIDKEYVDFESIYKIHSDSAI